ncbi:hypothetical protein SCP_0303960 [Sparassis crispa]|uniref:Uncharacterized protein n=1 Tax=Sparassis crispa TaxID=139825 RepID=A0A401GES6_9APHY|nr:hypothetical protein SCP_0303960 [Sparassis crispa]GBE80677.1 hypothetical protein SCP_0303960 [Sparassis crispa]
MDADEQAQKQAQKQADEEDEEEDAGLVESNMSADWDNVNAHGPIGEKHNIRKKDEQDVESDWEPPDGD